MYAPDAQDFVNELDYLNEYAEWLMGQGEVLHQRIMAGERSPRVFEASTRIRRMGLETEAQIRELREQTQ